MSTWYLFEPDHPARAEQVMQRLRVEGWKLVIERGTFAGWEVAETKRTLRMQRAIDARLAEARARGLAVESDPLVVLAGLSARHPELEAAIHELDDLASPAARELLSVYADFLQDQGDARGQLAAMQLRDRFATQTLRLARDHAAQLLGPVASSSISSSSLEWTGGWITAVDTRDLSWDTLPTLLRLPACASVRELYVRASQVPAVLSSCRATVRRLGIYGVRFEPIELGEVPKLDELILDGCPMQLVLSGTRLPKISVWNEPVVGGELRLLTLLLEDLSPLERLGLRIPRFCEARELLSFLEHPALSSLRELELRWEDNVGQPGPLPDELFDALLDAPLLRRLELRDFSRLVVADRDRLVEAFALASGRTWFTRP